MDEHEELIERLREVGRQPIDPSVRSVHLLAIERGRPAVSSKLRVAGAFLAGLLVGGSGLAVAGALPDPAQAVAHDVFERVGVQVPQPERHHGPECGPEARRNHGAYVRSDKSLAKTECGKPLRAADGAEADEPRSEAPGERGRSRADRDLCAGPPPWATDRSMTDEQKATAQAERDAACPDAADDAGEGLDDSPEAKAADPPTTTTSAPATTTTTVIEEPTTTSAA